MHRLSLSLLLLFCLPARGQSNWHTGFGLTSATLNFQQNGSAGFAIPLRYDLRKSDDRSLSIGTNISLGSEDKYGVGFPLILILLWLSYEGDTSPDFLTSSGSDSTQKGTSVCFFTSIPLLLHYNWGLGSNNYSNKRVGYYVGGGMSFTMTGYTNSAGHEHSTSFFGWVANVGVRFARNADLGFSATIPLSNPVGPIHNPLLYQLTFTFFNRD
jgi:hypothetical protein